MFQWKLWDDRIQDYSIAAAPSGKLNRGDIDNLKSLPISNGIETVEEDSSYNIPQITFSSDRPKYVVGINVFGGNMDSGFTRFRTNPSVSDTDQNEYPPNRIRIIETTDVWVDGSDGLTIQIQHAPGAHRDGHSHEFTIGALMFFDDWEECNRPDTINVETVTPQLMGDAETATPIPGVLAGRRKRVSMTWNGVAFDDPELKPLMNLLDELDDRRKPVLFRPSTDRPMYFFGRLERWNYASRGSTDTINATFITDGMGQP